MLRSHIEAANAQTLGRQSAAHRMSAASLKGRRGARGRNHYRLLRYGLGQWYDRKSANPRPFTLSALTKVLGTEVPELVEQMFSFHGPSPPKRS